MAHDLLPENPKQIAGEAPNASGRDTRPEAGARGRSKDDLVAVHCALLGRVPDSEVAKLAGVCVRTVATYRSRLGIPGYSGPRRRPPKRDGKRSMLDPLSPLIGVVPDHVVAEQAGMSIGAVRAFRVARGIDAAGARAPEVTRALVGAWSAENRKPAALTLGAWLVGIDDGSEGIVLAVNAKAAMELACGPNRAVVAIEYLGDLMTAAPGQI
jgi:hypothetical protein